MKVWTNGLEQEIKVLWNWPVNANILTASIKLDGSVWQTIGAMNNFNDNFYSILCTINVNGKYSIRVTDDINTLYERVEVQDETFEEYIKDTNFKVSNILKRWIKKGM